MKLTADTLNSINLLLKRYDQTKSYWLDFSGRKMTTESVELEIAELQERDGSEEEWIDLILKICKIAHGIQVKTAYCSKIVEVLFKVSDQMLCEIPIEHLNQEIKNRSEELLHSKEQNINYKNDSKKNEMISRAESKKYKKLYQLAWLGEPRYLMKELTMDEMKKHFPGSHKHKVKGWLGGEWDVIDGYEYSATDNAYGVAQVTSYMPLVLNRGPHNNAFQCVFDAKFESDNKNQTSVKREIKRPEWFFAKAKVNEESKEEFKSEFVTGMSVYPLTTLLSYYSNNKAFSHDSHDKMQKCAGFISDLNTLANKNASLSEWIDLIMRLGQTAHEAQTVGRFKSCSEFTRVLSVVRLELIAQLKVKVPQGWATFITRELNAFDQLLEDTSELKWKNDSVDDVAKKESIRKGLIYRFAWLEQKNMLLSFRQEEIEILFPKRLSGSVYSGYQYPEDSQPKGLTGEMKISTSLPFCLQSEFTLIWRHENAEGLKDMNSVETQKIGTASDVQSFTTDLEQFEKREDIQKLSRNQEQDAANLIALEINVAMVNNAMQDLAAFSHRFSQISTTLDTMKTKMDLPEKIKELAGKLELLGQLFKKIKEKIITAEREQAQQNARAQQKCEKAAEQKILEFASKVNTIQERYQKILDAADYSTEDLVANNIDTEAFKIELGALQSDQLLKDIQIEIKGTNQDQQMILKKRFLNPQLERLTAFETVINAIDEKLKLGEKVNRSAGFASSYLQVDALLPKLSVDNEPKKEEECKVVKVENGADLNKSAPDLSRKLYDEYHALGGKTITWQKWETNRKKNSNFIQNKLGQVQQLKQKAQAAQVRSRSPSPTPCVEFSD